MGGGVFPNPKFPYQKKLRFLLDFFCQKGGGLTYSKRVFIIKYWFLSSNALFFHQILSFFFNFSKYFFFDIKKYFFISEFIQKGEGGVWPNPKFLLTEKIRPSKLIAGGGVSLVWIFSEKYHFFSCPQTAQKVTLSLTHSLSHWVTPHCWKTLP